MNDYAKILWQAYERFILNVEGKKVPIPYRINIPPVEHPARQGKSDPEVILATLKEDAKEQNFDLEKASVEKIRQLMEKNKLGLDCSGFVYRMLDFLVEKIKGKPLTELCFDHVGRTNVAMLTDDEHCIKVKLNQIQPGDLIKLNSDKKISHCILVMEVKEDEIIYTHSSYKSSMTGVHLQKIKITDPQKPLEDQTWLEEFQGSSYDPKVGDEVKRLKILA